MRPHSAEVETRAALELESPGFKPQISHSVTGNPGQAVSPPSVSPYVEWGQYLPARTGVVRRRSAGAG